MPVWLSHFGDLFHQSLRYEDLSDKRLRFKNVWNKRTEKDKKSLERFGQVYTNFEKLKLIEKTYFF